MRVNHIHKCLSDNFYNAQIQANWLTKLIMKLLVPHFSIKGIVEEGVYGHWTKAIMLMTAKPSPLLLQHLY